MVVFSVREMDADDFFGAFEGDQTVDDTEVSTLWMSMCIYGCLLKLSSESPRSPAFSPLHYQRLQCWRIVISGKRRK